MNKRAESGWFSPILINANRHHPGNIRWLRALLSFIIVLILLQFPTTINGQESPIKATVSSTSVSTDEVVALMVTVTDDSSQQHAPILPDLDGLAVVDLDLSTDVSMVDGRLQTEVVYTYLLQPLRTGELTIPRIGLSIDDQYYRSDEISITVRQGTPPVPASENSVDPPRNFTPPPDLTDQDFFVETAVSTATPYVGEQIIHTFRIFQGIQLYREPQYNPDAFAEFDTRGLPVHQYNLDVKGRTYLVTEIRRALFPKQVGSVTIGPERLMLVGNIYEDPVELYADEIEVDVQALPDNAPQHFTGAVGQYEAEVWFSPQVAIEGQPGMLHIAIKGAGNIERLPQPVWPDVLGWRSFEALGSFTTEMQGDQLIGTRVYERLMVPDQTGEYTFPSISFVYFDPQSRQYRTISTSTLSVEVVPPPADQPPVQALPPTAAPLPAADTTQTTPDTASPAVTRPTISLRSVLDRLGGWAANTNLNIGTVLVLLLALCSMIPLAGAAGVAGVWLGRRQSGSASPTDEQPLPTTPMPDPLVTQQPRVHPALAAAMQGSDDNFRTIELALRGYLSNLLGYPIQGLTRRDLAARLQEKGLSQDLIEAIDHCLSQSEMGRFAPEGADAGWSLMAKADKVLSEIDQFRGEKTDLS